MLPGELMSFSQRKSIRLSRDAYARGNAYSITISTFMRYPWFKRHPELAASAMERLNATADERGTHLFVWCIMPDHMHLLLKDDNVVNFVRIFKGRLTPVARNLNSERSLWQRSFYEHALRKEGAGFIPARKQLFGMTNGGSFRVRLRVRVRLRREKP